MSVSKVQFDGNDLINLENDTVTAEVVRTGYTAHDANGDSITGTYAGVIPTGVKDITAETDTKSVDVSGYATARIAPTPSESKTLTLGSSAPSTVTPSSGKLLSSVPVSLDTSVIKADNIAEGVTMLGIAGTHSDGLYNGASGEDLFPNTTTNHTITISGTASSYQYERMFANSRGGYSDIIYTGTSVGMYAFQYFAQYGNIKSFSADNITRITDGREFYYGFQYGVAEKLSFKNLTSIGGNYAFYYLCNFSTNDTTLKEIDFSSLQTIAGDNTFCYAFQWCRGLYANKVAHPFPALTTVTGSNTTVFGHIFRYGKATMYVFDKLTSIATAASGANEFIYAFADHTWDYRSGDTDGRKCGVAFPLVTQVGYSSRATDIYRNCKYLMHSPTNNCALYMTELETIHNANTTNTNGQFAYCNADYIYMPKLTSMTTKSEYVFYSSTNTSELHFGIENRATIEAMTGYSTKFGATAATIYFDLANHITINGTVYDRNGNYDDYDDWYFGFTNEDSGVTYYINEYSGTVGDVVYTKSDDTYTVTAYIVTAVA